MDRRQHTLQPSWIIFGDGGVKEIHIYMARIYLAQARQFRRHGNWHATLLLWAANRRKMATEYQPMQAELFA